MRPVDLKVARYEQIARDLLQRVGLDKPDHVTTNNGGLLELGEYVSGERYWLLSCPWPARTIRQLFIVAHEVAHAIQHGAAWLEGKEPPAPHVMEYEANAWAITFLRSQGVAVPASILADAHCDVVMHAQRDAEAGISTDPRVKNWLVKNFSTIFT